MISRILRLSPIIVFVFIGSFIIYQSSLLAVVQAQNLGGVLGPAAYPKLLGFLMLLLSFIYIFKAWSEGNILSEGTNDETSSKPAYHLVFFSFIGLLVLTYLFERLGFIIMSALLMLWFMFMMGERNWRFMLISSFFFPLVVYLMFRYGFDIVLPEGVLKVFNS